MFYVTLERRFTEDRDRTQFETDGYEFRTPRRVSPHLQAASLCLRRHERDEGKGSGSTPSAWEIRMAPRRAPSSIS